MAGNGHPLCRDSHCVLLVCKATWGGAWRSPLPALAFSLSPHRHPFLYNPHNSRFIRYKKSTIWEGFTVGILCPTHRLNPVSVCKSSKIQQCPAAYRCSQFMTVVNSCLSCMRNRAEGKKWCGQKNIMNVMSTDIYNIHIRAIRMCKICVCDNVGKSTHVCVWLHKPERQEAIRW